MVLRVKLEIVPYGTENKAYEIGRLDIFNNGIVSSDSLQICKYGVIDLCDFPGLFEKQVQHNRAEGAWPLVEKVLRELDIRGPYGPHQGKVYR